MKVIRALVIADDNSNEKELDFVLDEDAEIYYINLEGEEICRMSNDNFRQILKELNDAMPQEASN